MAAIEYARGHRISISPTPKELIFFSLAKEFGWLPDEIERQEPKAIKGIMHVLSTYNGTKNSDIERSNRKGKLGLTGGGGRQVIDITNPEVEKKLENHQLKV